MEAFNFTVANEDCNLYTYDMRKLQAAACMHKVGLHRLSLDSTSQRPSLPRQLALTSAHCSPPCTCKALLFHVCTTDSHITAHAAVLDLEGTSHACPEFVATDCCCIRTQGCQGFSAEWLIWCRTSSRR